MCMGLKEYNGLNVPNVSLTEVAAWDAQRKYCEASLKMDRCNEDCEDCVFYGENFEDFKELYDGKMSDIL